MKKRSKVGLAAVGVSSLAWLWFNPLPAGASNIYSPFGNLRVGDCADEAMANLTLHEYPWATITTNEVIRAFRKDQGDPVNVLTYEMNTGFDGFKISGFQLITTREQIIEGVAGGGVWSGVDDNSHAVAVIGADRRFVTIVDDGIIEHWSWSNFYWNQGANPVMYSITWEGGTSTNS